ncbi:MULTISPECIES: SDR family NAD(P)-dependent oxidoreductase [Raoultella]
MRAQAWGRVINISSLAALMPPDKRPDYAAAKAGRLHNVIPVRGGCKR